MADSRAGRGEAESHDRGDKLSRIGARAILIGWVSICVGWTLQGMSLWATLRAMGAAAGRAALRIVAEHRGRRPGRRGRLLVADPRRIGNARVGARPACATSIRGQRCDCVGHPISPRLDSVGASDFDYSICGWLVPLAEACRGHRDRQPRAGCPVIAEPRRPRSPGNRRRSRLLISSSSRRPNP